MTLVLNLAIVACLGGAAYNAVRMHVLDRRLQAFRNPNAGAMSYVLVPLRWRRHLYVPAAQPLVDAAWRSLRYVYGWGLGAALLLLARNGWAS